ncbi:hypothetical protein AST07_01605 [Staphylococcus saprophyticus]|uniref:DUF4260 family protein n=1 Tax=Staphylococcus saprophyticus subsp. saprophyticus (strain ATCC 15305 / DSM 20229 / NCIMB 8711 / NCTC 7292 / S-41) TaxID=342451 RepID=Q49UR2_STAS1|nr:MULTISPECIES: DUF4260 domain-containing protein [Staphylococcus]CRV27700.1 Uncharacterised protein [Streptococcus equi subsp. equi]ASE58099.1 DUF4260 domain-containing protein [Staphylococcus saprophyticus]ASF19101.1 DUF4260 domain-containing protein [Staphylococcus saprophyticus]MBN6754476.1 DUF4260 domain-containing protein [Staphylococcus saprophyticus]MBN6764456.1 DUF4260 domain-containing protein [Staphylococcus saprophyticus]
MRNLIKVENAFVLILVISLYFMFDFSFWLFLIFLLAPDLTAIGYVFNKRIGSMVYNIGHTYVLPSLVTTLYLLLKEPILLQIALIWFAHISMDRTLGYGLKYASDFKITTIQKL